MKLSKREPKHMGEVMSDIAERYDKLTKTNKMSKEEIGEKLIDIYFKKCYMGFGEVTEEEEDFISQEIKCIPTRRNGYDIDKEHIREHLEVGKEYVLESMNVGQSSSSLTLKEFPTLSFNTVCFEFNINQNKEDDT